MTFSEVYIKVPDEMVMYINPQNQEAELTRNAMLLYPFIINSTISHGRAAEILGIRKNDLIELYNSLGMAYLSQDISEVDAEVASWEKIKRFQYDCYQ